MLTALLGGLRLARRGPGGRADRRPGRSSASLLGVAFLVLPLVVIWLIVREWMLAIDVQRMADELAAAGELPVDDLPRSPGGRIDRAVARERVRRGARRAEAAPDDWRVLVPPGVRLRRGG